jgi:hypothetical protein
MITKERLTTPPVKEGVDIPPHEALEVWSFLIDQGHEFLDGTAFVSGEPFGTQDIHALKGYYQSALAYQEQKFGERGAVFNRSLREHLGLAERIAEVGAPLLGIDIYLLQALMLTHDFGRLFSHRRGRNNAIETLLTKKLGFSEEFTNLLPPDSLWTDISPESLTKRLHTITTNNQGIVAAIELFDVLAKWKDKDQKILRRVEDIIPRTMERQNLPDPSDMWPSELKRQKKITSSEGVDAVATKYNYLSNWFSQTTGIEVNDFVMQVERSLQIEPIPLNWL